mmetsp:Transcript_30282/g.54835  ORF Transcript_30282/g.54835 Transcript_30282/m.54835 type:complete len:231 (-) Transcript_30282:173-865(-)
MAAIICTSFSKILRGACEGLGTILTLPCKACGFATDQLTDICRSPFCLYLSVALGLNLPPIIFTGKAWSARYGDEGCISASNWMNVNALLCLINMVAALYISAKITYEPETDNAAPFIKASVMDNEATAKTPEQREKTLVKKILESTQTDTRSKSLSRVKDILCYDPIVALYIIVGIFYVVWQTMGLGRSSLTTDCGGGLDQYLFHSLICGFLFISLGGMTFACSLCCMA